MTGTISLARAFFDAVEAGDLDAVRAMFTDDAVIWNNHLPAPRDVDAIMQMLFAVRSGMPDLRYEEVRAHAIEGGFVEQHRVRGATASGAVLDVQACVVATVVDGRIARFEEYLDSAALFGLA